jgi:hypothetical protein
MAPQMEPLAVPVGQSKASTSCASHGSQVMPLPRHSCCFSLAGPAQGGTGGRCTNLSTDVVAGVAQALSVVSCTVQASTRLETIGSGEVSSLSASLLAALLAAISNRNTGTVVSGPLSRIVLDGATGSVEFHVFGDPFDVHELRRLHGRRTHSSHYRDGQGVSCPPSSGWPVGRSQASCSTRNIHGVSRSSRSTAYIPRCFCIPSGQGETTAILNMHSLTLAWAANNRCRDDALDGSLGCASHSTLRRAYHTPPCIRAVIFVSGRAAWPQVHAQGCFYLLMYRASALRLPLFTLLLARSSLRTKAAFLLLSSCQRQSGDAHAKPAALPYGRRPQKIIPPAAFWTTHCPT